MTRAVFVDLAFIFRSGDSNDAYADDVSLSLVFPCTASCLADPCMAPGSYDKALGICGSGSRPDGTSCNDGNPCTASDVCIAGRCTGGTPIVCQALDTCHVAGVCDPATGCSNPTKPNGTSCDDLNACTRNDQCFAGSCTGTAPAIDGTQLQRRKPMHHRRCLPFRLVLRSCGDLRRGRSMPRRRRLRFGDGQLRQPAPKPDGTACDDGNACTRTDTCQTGTCTGGNAVVCTGGDACHVASCNPGRDRACPSTGRTGPPAPTRSSAMGRSRARGEAACHANPIACDDGNPCTADSCAEPGTCTSSAVADGTPCLASNGVTGRCASAACETGAPDFTFTVNPGSVTVPQGRSGSAALRVAPVNGFADAVSFSASSVPGVTISFTPAFVSTSGTATMTFTVSPTAAPGTSAVTLSAASPAQTHTASFTLIVTTAGAPVYQVRSGNTEAAPPFQADQFASGGNTTSTGQPIDTTGVADPAPEAVYQSVRYGDFSYTFPGLTPGGAYAVRLHFAESYSGGFIGERLFDVAINGAAVLPRFDVTEAAGGANKALVEQFNTTADTAGAITIQFNGALVSGLEILNGSIVPSAPYALRAVPGDGQVSLSWRAGAGASTYNVYRRTAAGAPTLSQAAIAGTTFVDQQATDGTKYFYYVTAVNAAGEGTASNEVSATPTAGAAPVYQIACGDTTDVPPYQRDQYFTGGNTTATGQSMDTSGVAIQRPRPSTSTFATATSRIVSRASRRARPTPCASTSQTATTAASSATASSTSRSTARTCSRGSTSPPPPAPRSRRSSSSSM